MAERALTSLIHVGTVNGQPSTFVHEVVLNSYDRASEFKISAADDYWAKTKTYWASVRADWDSYINFMKAQLTELSEEHQYKVLRGNAERLFRFEARVS